ncbi:MAG: hypothetical protein JXR58_10125 [Bacteroidales bacterium]|nr:hypothetical protein [Bacteroidales bacterium]
MKNNSSDSRKQNILYIIGLLSILGLALLTWSLNLWSKTVIRSELPLVIFLSPGIIFTLIFFRRINRIIGKRVHLLTQYFVFTLIIGSLSLFCLLGSNFYFADSEIINKEYRVKEYGKMDSSRGQRNRQISYVNVDFSGIEKRIIVSESIFKDAEKSGEITLVVKNGWLGMEIF